MTEDDKTRIMATWQHIVEDARARQAVLNQSSLPKIHIGMATCGIASGALETRTAFEDALKARGIDAHVHSVGCMGHCYAEPWVIVDSPGSGFAPILYPEVTPGKAKMLVSSFLGTKRSVL